MEILSIMALLFFLFFLSVPIFISLFIVSFIALTLYQDIPIIIIGQDMFNKLNSYTLLAVLFFIIAGNIMGRGKNFRKINSIFKINRRMAQGRSRRYNNFCKRSFRCHIRRSYAYVSCNRKFALPLFKGRRI